MVKRLAIEIFLVTLIGLALGLFGPFGTYAIPTAMRIAYWVSFGLIGYAIFRPLIIVGRWMSEALAVPAFVGIAFALVLAALPMTVMVAMLMFQATPLEALQWSDFWQLYFQVWLIGFLTNGLFTLLFRKGDAGGAAPGRPEPAMAASPLFIQPSAPPFEAVQEEPAPAPPRFADRLPPGFGPVIAMKGEDHYVRVFAATDGGTHDTLVLIRLRDAVAEMGEEAGLLVHRSWWVARGAVQSVTRDGRTMTLHLAGNLSVPVARNAVAQVGKTPWLLSD